MRGEPEVPVLRMHELGDYQVPPSLMQGYGELVRRKGLGGGRYRSAVVDGTGHCDFTAAENGAAVETMMRRLDRGEWGRTPAAARGG